ncbi:hypothetical protein A2U01_0092621, partial [Trifolium medium]|nr:hypothetical protein [Trifolium medium]
ATLIPSATESMSVSEVKGGRSDICGGYAMFRG